MAGLLEKLRGSLLFLDRDINSSKQEFGVVLYDQVHAIYGKDKQTFLATQDDQLIVTVRPKLLATQREIAALLLKHNNLQNEMEKTVANSSQQQQQQQVRSNNNNKWTGKLKTAALKTQQGLLERKIQRFKEQLGMDLYDTFVQLQDDQKQEWLPIDPLIRCAFEECRKNVDKLQTTKKQVKQTELTRCQLGEDKQEKDTVAAVADDKDDVICEPDNNWQEQSTEPPNVENDRRPLDEQTDLEEAKTAAVMEEEKEKNEEWLDGSIVERRSALISESIIEEKDVATAITLEPESALEDPDEQTEAGHENDISANEEEKSVLDPAVVEEEEAVSEQSHPETTELHVLEKAERHFPLETKSGEPIRHVDPQTLNEDLPVPELEEPKENSSVEPTQAKNVSEAEGSESNADSGCQVEFSEIKHPSTTNSPAATLEVEPYVATDLPKEGRADITTDSTATDGSELAQVETDEKTDSNKDFSDGLTETDAVVETGEVTAATGEGTPTPADSEDTQPNHSSRSVDTLEQSSSSECHSTEQPGGLVEAENSTNVVSTSGTGTELSAESLVHSDAGGDPVEDVTDTMPTERMSPGDSVALGHEPETMETTDPENPEATAPKISAAHTADLMDERVDSPPANDKPRVEAASGPKEGISVAKGVAATAVESGPTEPTPDEGNQTTSCGTSSRPGGKSEGDLLSSPIATPVPSEKRVARKSRSTKRKGKPSMPPFPVDKPVDKETVTLRKAEQIKRELTSLELEEVELRKAEQIKNDYGWERPEWTEGAALSPTKRPVMDEEPRELTPTELEEVELRKAELIKNEYSWEKPEWAERAPLRSPVKVKECSAVAKKQEPTQEQVELRKAEQIKKEYEWEKPEWAKKVVLKSTKKKNEEVAPSAK